MFTAKTLLDCIEFAGFMGNVTSAHMYDDKFIVVEVTSRDGKDFSITMNAKEEKEDGN